MADPFVETESILAIDLGLCNTRAFLFDLVDGNYRLIAFAVSPSTTIAPLNDPRIGVFEVIAQLEKNAGRQLLSSNKTLISPSGGGNGIDCLINVYSAGPAFRTVLVGLVKDDSLKSIRNLADTAYTEVVDCLSMGDQRKPDEWIDTIIKIHPDTILIAGGTDNGASISMRRLADYVGLACYLIPAAERPSILFTGNQALADGIKESFGSLASSVRVSSNIRPFGNVEDLQPAAKDLSEMITQVNRNRSPGFEELYAWSGGYTLPSCYAHGRMVRFMSKAFELNKAIMAVDLGASAATISFGFNGQLIQGVYPQFGLGNALIHLLDITPLESVTRWLTVDISPDYVQNYLNQKGQYPSSIPVTREDMVLEQAVARQVLSLAVEQLRKKIPSEIPRLFEFTLPYCEPILVSGSVLLNAPAFGQTLLILLDSLQPVGTTTFILDPNHLLPILGAVADVNPSVPVQVLESGVFEGLAFVVTPVSNARQGTPLLSGSLITNDGNTLTFEIDQGTFEVLPLPIGKSARLLLEPRFHVDVGFGYGKKGEVEVSGTHLGVVFDARGRPLLLSGNDNTRREMMNKWIWSLES
ncbi:MAG TPA: glutamate mutase L [Anaerolineales bacterium]|nr:glutamate mutase L [Anaerolineales bacterium]